MQKFDVTHKKILLEQETVNNLQFKKKKRFSIYFKIELDLPCLDIKNIIITTFNPRASAVPPERRYK